MMASKNRFTDEFKKAIKAYNSGRHKDGLNIVLGIEKYKKLIPHEFLLRVYFLKGDICHELKKYSEAVKAYSVILSFKKSDIAYANKALALWELKRYKDALMNYIRAIKVNGKNAIALRGAGEMHLKLNKPKNAINNFKKAIKLNPKYSDAISSLGLAFYNKNDFPSAYKQFSKALKLNKQDVLARRGIELISKHFDL